MIRLWRYFVAKKNNDLLISELNAKYQVLADIDMKNYPGVRIEVIVYDEDQRFIDETKALLNE